jgi:electron transfer flavoprotein beta subunit
MKILVCIKQVLDASSPITIDSHAKWIDESKTAFKMNSYDEHALEEALKIKDHHPGTEVHALSIGPPRVLSCLKRALEMGADDAFHIITEPGFIKPQTTSGLIAQHVRNFSYDLILCGQMAEDDMLSATGPMIAAITDLPFCTNVTNLNLFPEQNTIHIKRELSGGKKQGLELKLPCLLCIQSGINILRYPSLSNVLRAKKHLVTTLDFMVPEDASEPFILTYPDRTAAGYFISGNIEEKAQKLARLFHERSLI